MQSPFPGMDPFIEACGLWGDFHYDLIAEIKHALAKIAPERYLVRTQERSYIVLVEESGKESHAFLPEVSVTTKRRHRGGKKKSGPLVAEPTSAVGPLTMRAFVREEFREAFVEIYEADPEQRLVTSIEVLSPSNKCPYTPGSDLYLRKRQSHMLGGVHLVEIDLLRGGQRMPMLDAWPKTAYTLLVARANRDGYCQVWPATCQQPLPMIPVPLAKSDPDMPLELQPLIAAIYQRSRYERSIDYSRSLTPPLDREERACLDRHLQSRAGRK
jgi:hypothetical protein